MTTNPPPDPAAEDAIADLLGWYKRDNGWFQPKNWNKEDDLDVTNVMAALLALIAKRELEARIDELSWARDMAEKDITGHSLISETYVNERLAQLKAQDDPGDYYALTGDFRP